MRLPNSYCLFGLALAAATCGYAVACSSSENPSSDAPRPDASDGEAGGDEIIIGASLGLSGGLADFALPQQNALRVAEDHINASGGILGKRVRFDIQDDASDDSLVRTQSSVIGPLWDNWAQRKVAAVIGPIGSGQAAAIWQESAQNKLLNVSIATSLALSKGFDAGSRYFFRTTPPDDLQAKAVAKFAYGKTSPQDGADGAPPAKGCRNMIAVYIDNDYATSMLPIIEASFKAEGADAVWSGPIKVPTKVKPSYADEVLQVLDRKPAPECLLLVMYDPVAAQFMRNFRAEEEVRDLPDGYFILGTDGIYTRGLLRLGLADESNPNSTSFVEGIYGTAPDTNNSDLPAYRQFVNLYTARFPLANGETDVPPFAANTFDAALLLALAIERAGTASDSTKIRDALVEVSRPGGVLTRPADFVEGLVALKRGEDVDYDGASGAVDIDADTGSVSAGYVVWQVRNKKYATIQRIPVATLK